MTLKNNFSHPYKEEISAIREDIKAMENAFNNAVEQEIIDSCIYNLKALNVRYSHYLSLSKEPQKEYIK